MNPLAPATIILASTSPRRIELLAQARIPVLPFSPNAEEKRKAGETPRAMVARLAEAKGLSALEGKRTGGALAPGRILVISADTIVLDPIDPRKVLCKPRDKKDAVRMLKRLSGHTHTVLTGYCILGAVPGKQKIERLVRVIKSRVSIRKLSHETLAHYVDTGEPMDKAGAYAAQGLGMLLIERINGSYTNVVGLPMAQLLKDLEDRYDITPFDDVRRRRASPRK